MALTLHEVPGSRGAFPLGWLGRALVAGRPGDDLLLVWDDLGAPPCSLAMPDGVVSPTPSPDGTRFAGHRATENPHVPGASMTIPNAIAVWSVTDGRPEDWVPGEPGQTLVATRLAWSPDGTGLAAKTTDGPLRLARGPGRVETIAARGRLHDWDERGVILNVRHREGHRTVDVWRDALRTEEDVFVSPDGQSPCAASTAIS